jgi:hypothetical protein
MDTKRTQQPTSFSLNLQAYMNPNMYGSRAKKNFSMKIKREN